MTNMNINNIPENWKIRILNKIIEKTNQIDPKKNSQKKIKYIDVSSISNESFKIINFKVYKGEDAPSRARKIIKTNDVIFATIRPNLKRISLVDKEFNDELCSTAFCVLRPKSEILDYRFLFYFLITDLFVNKVSEYQKGSSYPAVTDNTIKAQEIFLPPLDEQKKIAHVLSLVQEAKEKTEAVIAAAKELKKSMMKHLFTYGPVPVEEADKVKLKETEIGPIPEDWEVTNMESIAEKHKYAIVDGPFGSSIKKNDYRDTGIPIIRIKNISKDGKFVNKDFLYISKEKYEKLKRSAIKKNDILVSRVGTIGNTCVYPGIFKYALLSTTGVCKLSLDSSKVNNEFIYYFMQTNNYKNQLLENSSASVQKYISLSVLKNSKVPLALIDEQKRISIMLKNIDYKIEAEENKKRALEELFKSLLNNLMTGEIRVNHMELKE